jgi:ABC-type lipoprotein release transport system permease subunit
MALIVVLSVFNGFEEVVSSLYNVFDPELKITLAEGKTFRQDELPARQIRSLPGVAKYTEVLEENALLRYHDRQYLATVKGVDSLYLEDSPLDSLLVEGDLVIQADSFNFAIPGYGIAYYLGIMIDDPDNLISVYVPDRDATPGSLQAESFRSEMIRPSGIFSVQQEFDNTYMFVPLRFVRTLLNAPGELTSVEIRLKKGADAYKMRGIIAGIAGDRFRVQDRYQQQALLYKTMKSEKWAIFFILAFILVIATFNMLGSITMLILDKRNDIQVLRSLGADRQAIRKIFFMEGMLINLTGALAGLILGTAICWLQQEYGLIKLSSGSGSFVINAYPVKMKALDFLQVFATVTVIGCIAAWVPVRQADRKLLREKPVK